MTNSELYQTAIHAREFHYQNLNYWTNFYAIVNGALFVAYYNIVDKISIDDILKMLVVALGFLTALAWIQTVRGHYYWLLSWTNIVKIHENVVVAQGQKKVYDDFKEQNKDFHTGNVSTQRITVRIVGFLCVAWFGLCIFQASSLIKKYCFCCFCHCVGVCLIMLVLIGVCMFLFLGVKSRQGESREKRRTKFLIIP